MAPNTPLTPDTHERARECRSEVLYGSWPHRVGVVREAGLSEDLSEIQWRCVRGVRVYDRNDVSLTLTPANALALYHALGGALAAVGQEQAADALPDTEPEGAPV